ncbi:hypothetical protein [Paenibacillus sp. NPDC058174]|uniref:hypothetical protein n=1 Tax=Paenibacillus sp. NPDC058174 TaxID=3346366 RepID=UPI0036D979A9
MEQRSIMVVDYLKLHYGGLTTISYWSDAASQNSEAIFAVGGVSPLLQGNSELNFAVGEPRFANSENQFAARREASRVHFHSELSFVK